MSRRSVSKSLRKLPAFNRMRKFQRLNLISSLLDEVLSTPPGLITQRVSWRRRLRPE